MIVVQRDAAAGTMVAERRRPGRPAHISPELIPLLRGEAPLVPNDPIRFDEPDELGAARGIALGVGISAVLWAAIAYGGYLLLS
jgi:hypothetical protein